MFLNLNSPHHKSHLNLNYQSQKAYKFQSNNNKSYLSSSTLLANHNNKQKGKSYSTSSLKQQFINYKNKNHSLVNSRLNHNPVNNDIYRQKNRQFSPLSNLQQRHRIQYNMNNAHNNNNHNNNNRFFNNNDKGLKLNINNVNNFKKSYLNLDTKLNKCTMNRDYFKPINQQRNYQYNQYKQQKHNKKNHNNNQNYQVQFNQHDQVHSVTNLEQQYNINNNINNNNQNNDIIIHEKMLQQINKLREELMINKIDNQELRKQRNNDLELIARQNQIIKGQEDIMIASQNKIKYLINQGNYKGYEDSSAFSFRNQLDQSKILQGSNYRAFQCPDCSHKRIEQKVSNQFNQIKHQKIEQQKKLMRKQIHQLVYTCQKLKQQLKRTEQKYQKQLGHNQRLVKMICENNQQQKDIIYSNGKGNKGNKGNNNYKQRQRQQQRQKQRITTKKLLNINNKIDYQPISIKKQTQKYLMQMKNHKNLKISENMEYVDHLKYQSNKLGHYKSAASLLRFNNQDEQSISIKNSQTKSPKDLDWCESDNIKKYLKQINQQKIKQIDQIQNLLKYQ